VQVLDPTRLFKNRGGAAIAAGIVALLAAILLLVYLQSYRSSLNSGKQPVVVLVANGLIPQGTSGTIIARKHLYQVTKVQKDQVKLFAIADPAAIKGRIAAADIFPGQQLTQGDFTTEATASIPYQITGTDRAIAIPVDSAHGLVGQVSAGNFVDVYVGVSASSGTVKLLASNILVLVAPGANAVLRVPTSEAPKFAFAADNAKIWLVLRPQVGASRTPPASATLASLLAGGR
jgi:Flp pilus assembly protein CpaB